MGDTKEEEINQITDIQNIKISDLHRFSNHPFKVENDVDLFKLMQSIEKEGVLIPLLARPSPKGKGLEIISGHRRVEASKWAGLKEVPVIIKELDDNESIIAMVDSNLQREKVKPSEKAFAYKMKMEAIKRQGKRTDIEEKLTSAPVGLKLEEDIENLHSDIKIGLEVGESRNQVNRYIRLTYLIPDILEMVDLGKIAFRTAVEISFLKEEEQKELYEVMDMEDATPSLSQAAKLKRLSKENKIGEDTIFEIMLEKKPNQVEQIKIRADYLADYFPKDFTNKDKEELIKKLVKAWSINYKEKQKKIKQEGKIK